MVQGDGPTNRTGIQVRSKSLTFKLNCAVGTSGVNVNRFILFLDKQPNGVAPAIADLLTTGGSVTPIDALRNLGNSKRFIVIRDMRWTQVSTSDSQQRVFEFTVPLKFLTQYYVGQNNGTVADIATNALWFMTVGDAALGNGSLMNGVIRYRFQDQ